MKLIDRIKKLLRLSESPDDRYVEDRPPHPRNVPGPFYVVEHCCLFCKNLHQEAPALMASTKGRASASYDSSPATPEEVYRAVRAFAYSCVGCLRYGGDDPRILKRLAEIGDEDSCDQPPPPGSGYLLRNHVTFQARASETRGTIADALRRQLDSQHSHCSDFKPTTMVDDGAEVHRAMSWFEDEWHALRMGPGEPGTGRWLIQHSPIPTPASVPISLRLDDWLRGDDVYSDIRWYTADQWSSGKGKWQPLPC